MQRYDLRDYRHLLQKSTEDLEWYWNAVNEDLDLQWFKVYDRVVDPSSEIQNTKWFLNGKCNIFANAIEKHAKERPDKVAYILFLRR